MGKGQDCERGGAGEHQGAAMKVGWEIKTLGDLFDITSSKRVFESDWKREGVPFYRAREIVKLAKQGFVDNELFISEEMFKQYSAKYGIPTAGDIMVTGVGTLGICFVVKESDRFYFKDGNIIWLKKKSEANSRFVEYAFQSDYLRKQIDDSVGATVGTFTIVKAKSTLIPVPPLPEQQRIVGILDEAFAGLATAKANATKNLQNARALFESHLQSVFAQRSEGWVEKRKPLAELCELIVDCEHKTAPTQGEGIPSIRTPNIGKGKLLLEGVNRVSEHTYKAWTRRAEPLAGDLILAREAPAGNVAVIPENTRVCLGQRTVLIRPKSDVFEPSFLALLLLEPKTQGKLLAHSRGATVQHVNMKDIRALDVGAIPSLGMQKSIVTTLASLDEETQRLEGIYQQKLAALEALKKSLLHQAFSGAL